MKKKFNLFSAEMATRSEDEISRTLDRCFADSLLKIGGGLAIGIVASFALFKGRTFPVWLGTGIGKFIHYFRKTIILNVCGVRTFILQNIFFLIFCLRVIWSLQVNNKLV